MAGHLAEINQVRRPHPSPPFHPPLHRHTHHRPVPHHPSHCSPSASRNPHPDARGPLPSLSRRCVSPSPSPSPSPGTCGRWEIHYHRRSAAPSEPLRPSHRRPSGGNCQPTEPLQPEPSRAARAGRRPSRHPSSSLRYPSIRVVAARAAAVPRAGTRGSHRPSPVGCPRPPLCLSQGPVCPPIFSPLRGGLGQFPRSSAVNMQKWDVNSEHGA